jgi:GntR family transcriptional regulator
MSRPVGGLPEALGLAVDKGAPTPAYLQLRARLAGAVADGRLAPGSALPSERDLAEGLGLARMTVRRAVEALVEEGLLERRHGSGTYVRGPALVQTFDHVQGFTDEARTLGFSPGTTLLEIREAPAGDEAAAALDLESGTPVLIVTRLRTAAEAPLAVQSAALPPRYAGLSLDLLRRKESLYATLAEQFGVAPHHARQTVTARLPSRSEQRRLQIGPHEPVLALERTTYAADGHVFEYVRSAYRGDRYRMALELGPPETAGAASGEEVSS